MKARAWILTAFVMASMVAHATPGAAKPLDISAPLPDSVEQTYRATFPKGEISKLDVSEENGVTVYDIEFRDGELEKETDIAADGTMLEFTLVIDAKAVPAAAMKTIRKTAAGAKLGRIERIELSYETKDGAIVKLPAPETRYAAEMTKKNLKAEVIVSPAGKVIEPAEWIAK